MSPSWINCNTKRGFESSSFYSETGLWAISSLSSNYVTFFSWSWMWDNCCKPFSFLRLLIGLSVRKKVRKVRTTGQFVSNINNLRRENYLKRECLCLLELIPFKDSCFPISLASVECVNSFSSKMFIQKKFLEDSKPFLASFSGHPYNRSASIPCLLIDCPCPFDLFYAIWSFLSFLIGIRGFSSSKPSYLQGFHRLESIKDFILGH